MKYLINLFQYLQAHESFVDITQKQSYILMEISLRIIIEYPIIGNFFKENKFIKMKKKPAVGNENNEYLKNMIKTKKTFEIKGFFK